jgi:hypothetical protein
MTENVPTGEEVLALPLTQFCRWTGGDNTIRAYLTELLVQLWAGDADPKYGMIGDSDWQYDLYDPLCDAGFIPAWQDGFGVGFHRDGTQHPEDQERADALINSAIRALWWGEAGIQVTLRRPKLFLVTVNPESYETQNAVVFADNPEEARAILIADIRRQLAAAPRRDFGEDHYRNGEIETNWHGEYGFDHRSFTVENVTNAKVTEIDGPLRYTLGVDG